MSIVWAITVKLKVGFVFIVSKRAIDQAGMCT